MKQHEGWCLPEAEQHIQKYLKSGQPYQANKQNIAMMAANRYSMAIDIGAHIGMWSWSLCRTFKRVVAFEPVKEYADCIAFNAPRAEVIRSAVGNERREVAMAIPEGNTGAAHVAVDGIGRNVNCIRIDDCGYAPDLIKIDVEGYELYALMGAENTIKAHYPVIVVECKRGPAKYGLKQTAAIDYLTSLGYDISVCVDDDWIVKRREYRG